MDSETTGFYLDSDYIVEWGHVLVDNGEIVDRLSLKIDWAKHEKVDALHFATRLHATRQFLQADGKAYNFTPALLQAEGCHPNEAFSFIRKFTETLKANGVFFVGHNLMFDERMLAANIQRYNYGPGFTFGDHWIDTEGIEKASQASLNSKMHPTADDTLRSYWHRVRYARINGIRSDLGNHCFRRYGFDTNFGLRPEDMHGAENDAYCCHLLMTIYGKLYKPPQTPALQSAEPFGSAAPSGSRRVRGQRCS